MTIQGLRTTLNFVTDERPLNWRQGILLLDPNGMAPLTALTSAMRTKSTDDPEFNWWEKELASQRIALNMPTGSGTGSPITVVAGALQLKAGHVLLQEESTELMLVTTDPTTDISIAVTRGIGGPTRGGGGVDPVSVDSDLAGVNPNITVVGTAHAEGSLAPTGINYDVTKFTNFSQIFRNTLKATRTARRTRLRTADAIREARREALQYHTIELERAFWFGQAEEDTTNVRRVTGGILGSDANAAAFIDAANVFDAGDTSLPEITVAGEVDMDALEKWLEIIFRFGSSEKMAFCGNKALLTIQQIVRKNSQMNIQSGIKEFGMAVTRITTAFGELVIKTHPLFNLMTGGTTTAVDYFGMNTSMVILDMGELVYRPLDDTKFEGNIQTPGEDAFRAGYLTEAGMEIHFGKAHGWIKALNKGIADT